MTNNVEMMNGIEKQNKKLGKRIKKSFFSRVSGFLLFVQLLILFVPFSEVLAAQVTIDAAVTTASTDHTKLGAASVFTTDQIGYKFYVDGTTNTCVYSKTVNGGANWAAAVTVDSDATCFGIVVWYDRWTPGDNGNYIHILTMDTTDSDLWYNRLDTTDDERLLAATPTSTIVASGQTPTIAVAANNASITKGTDGTLYMALNDNNDRFVVECSSDCGTATSWSETGTTPMDLTLDWSLLMPLSGGDILLINRDIDGAAEDMRSKVWDDSAGSWSGAWTTIDGNALDNTTFDPGFAASVNPNTGVIYLAYIDWATTGTLGGNNDDVKTASYSATSSTWTARADVITNTTRGLSGVAVGVDINTNTIYVGYSGRTTPATATTGNVYWKSSTNNMTGWSAETGPVNTLAEDIYGIDINTSNYDRLGLSWYGTTNDDMYIENVMANPTPTTEVLERGIQNTEVRASTTNFYVGGAFVIDENVGTRDVTSITITEAGTVDASTALDNIRLRYDLDTSNPYDCASESYGGSEPQFGALDTNGFSSANGTSTFSTSTSISISTTQSMCVYAVMDITKAASDGETIEIEIANPSTDVTVSGGVTPVPHYGIALDGETSITLDTDFRVQRGFFTMSTDTHTLTAGIDYDAPVSSTSAFIRITNSGYTGAGPDIGAGTRNSDDVTVYMTNPENIETSVTFQRGVAAVSNTRVMWEIIEYKGVAGGENEIKVRRQEDLAYVSGNATLSSSAISGVVDDTDIVVFITGQYNSNTGATVYSRGQSTAAWNAGSDTVTFTRGATGSVVNLSYAVVEFTGSNWRIQRSENTYAAAGATETENITAVNSLTRTFLHTQKRFSVSTHANFGHEVWLSGLGQISYFLDAAATTPAGQVSVAWVIENIQTLGTPMNVTRVNGGPLDTVGTSPERNIMSIGATLDDLSVSSIFLNNRAGTANNTWPEPILGVMLLSTTQYEIWRSDISANINFRAEIVEWPTAVRKIEQGDYWLYVDNNALTPTDRWGTVDIGESAEMLPEDGAMALGDNVRIRMGLKISGASLPPSIDSYKLEFGKMITTCSAVTTWWELGDSSSTTAYWRGVANTPVDGTALSTDPPTGGDLVLTDSTVSGTYEEGNDTAANPFVAFPNDQIEYDWVVEHNGADDKSSYCFRMTEADGTLFQTYTHYPTLRTVGYEPLVLDWRWYDDETNTTPTTPLAGENVAPTDIVNENAVKLRVVLREASGANGDNAKFAIQFSEYSDFSQAVATATAISECVEDSLWCYYDGNGTNNGVINSAVLSSADTCSGGVGDGCGTYNESTSTSGATVDQTALTNTEFEFTIQHSGARASAVYYFRLYDVANDEFVITDVGSNYPSLVTQGPQLSFSVGGLDAGTTTAGVVLDATTTPTTIEFGSVPIGTSYEAAQRFNVNTNSTDGYQLLQYVTQQMVNSYGDEIPPFGASNATPASWATGCISSMSGCFGYHTTDASLQGGSTRFAANDLYAAFNTNPEEVMYSSIYANDVYDIVYRLQVSQLQPAGDYETTLVYIAVPSF